jgi:hypothetical protein
MQSIFHWGGAYSSGVSRKEKEIEKLCGLCAFNDPDKSGEWAVNKYFRKIV